MASDRNNLRRDLRNRRRQLSLLQQQSAADRLYHLVMRWNLFMKSGRIAFYFASDGEIDPLAILFRALQMGKACYLPVLSPYQHNKVCFAPFRKGDALQPNRWGILEPVASVRSFIAPWSLNLVFVPLVGFDATGNRLGMGKGYYDRTFAFRARRDGPAPRLIGLAHECQRAEAIPVSDWDIPLDGVVSDRGIYEAMTPAAVTIAACC